MELIADSIKGFFYREELPHVETITKVVDSKSDTKELLDFSGKNIVFYGRVGSNKKFCVISGPFGSQSFQTYVRELEQIWYNIERQGHYSTTDLKALYCRLDAPLPSSFNGNEHENLFVINFILAICHMAHRYNGDFDLRSNFPLYKTKMYTKYPNITKMKNWHPLTFTMSHTFNSNSVF